MYLIVDTSKEELPLATADTISELADICNTTVSNVSKIIRYKRTTRLFGGLPSRIYKIEDDE
jgi:hypothetical protein